MLEQVDGTDTHQLISKSQAAAIIETARQSPGLTAVERAELSTLVANMKWATPEDRTAVLTALQPAEQSGKLPAGVRRRSQQDWTAIWCYGDSNFWSIMQSDANTYSKLAALVELCIRTGLRCPSEHTIKFIASMWVVATHKEEELVVMGDVAKISLMKHAKGVFDNYRKRAREPVEYITELPASPSTLLAEHEALYRAAFPSAAVGPVQPQGFAFAKVTAFDQSYGCRAGARATPYGMPTQIAKASVPSVNLSPTRALERMAGHMLHQMEAMSVQQNRFMEMMLGGGGGGGPLVRSLSLLEDRRPQALPITDVGQAVAKPMQPIQPPQQLALPNFGGAPAAQPPSGSQPPQELAIAKAPSAVEAMLDVFSARRSDKAAQKQTRGSDGPLPAAPPAKMAKLKHKPLEGASAIESSKAGPPAMAKAKSTTKYAIVGTSKPKPAVVAKAKAKAVPTVDPKLAPVQAVDPKPAPKAVCGLILGCSKCRNSVKGCSQCRNPAYSGHRWNITCPPVAKAAILD